MTRGRKPKPAAQKEFEGNPGKRRLKREPEMAKPAPKDAEPPPQLSDAAKEEWARVYPILLNARVLTMGDLQTLAIYCALYARWLKAEAKLAELNGAWIVKTPNDHLQAIPWITISNRAAELMKGYLSELSMTPASRARMGVDDQPTLRPGQNRPQLGGRFAEYMGRK